MTFLIGIVGKPSSGKSTFLNAACLTNAKVSELPFTTIDPNKGVAYIKSDCVCKELGVKDNPKNSYCIDGNRFVPVNLLDVAGLVPDAHRGKGLGNKFLNDLSKAAVLIHIVDITGSLDKMGNRIKEGANNPYEDVLFLEEEIDLWFKQILEREDWDKFLRTFSRESKKFVEELSNRVSGIKVSKFHIIEALKQTQLNEKNPAEWSDVDLLNFSKVLRRLSKPILIAANKIDKEIGVKNLITLKSSYKDQIIPCCALAEYYLRKYDNEGIIKYIPGSNDFSFMNLQNLNEKEVEMLKEIKSKILTPFNGTGVQEILNYSVFNIGKQICVYPVADFNNFTDNSGNILPDAFIIEEGTTLKEFVNDYIHSDLAKHFIYGVDARSKKRLSENYRLKHNDIIKIVSAK
jgi:ribosome-binding ATPase YchF (GTP1/OBG family)